MSDSGKILQKPLNLPAYKAGKEVGGAKLLDKDSKAKEVPVQKTSDIYQGDLISRLQATEETTLREYRDFKGEQLPTKLTRKDGSKEIIPDSVLQDVSEARQRVRKVIKEQIASFERRIKLLEEKLKTLKAAEDPIYKRFLDNELYKANEGKKVLEEKNKNTIGEPKEPSHKERNFRATDSDGIEKEFEEFKTRYEKVSEIKHNKVPSYDLKQLIRKGKAFVKAKEIEEAKTKLRKNLKELNWTDKQIETHIFNIEADEEALQNGKPSYAIRAINELKHSDCEKLFHYKTALEKLPFVLVPRKDSAEGDLRELVLPVLQASGYYNYSVLEAEPTISFFEAALKEFQRDHNLKADGILGDKTLEMLDKAREYILNTDFELNSRHEISSAGWQN